MQIGRVHASCNNQEAKPVKDLDLKKNRRSIQMGCWNFFEEKFFIHLISFKFPFEIEKSNINRFINIWYCNSSKQNTNNTAGAPRFGKFRQQKQSAKISPKVIRQARSPCNNPILHILSIRIKPLAFAKIIFSHR